MNQLYPLNPVNFGAKLIIQDSVKRDWGDGVVNCLAALQEQVAQLPPEIEEISFSSVSGDGMTTRAVAYDDLWVSVQKKGEAPQSTLLTDGLSCHLPDYLRPSHVFGKAKSLINQMKAKK